MSIHNGERHRFSQVNILISFLWWATWWSSSLQRLSYSYQNLKISWSALSGFEKTEQWISFHYENMTITGKQSSQSPILTVLSTGNTGCLELMLYFVFPRGGRYKVLWSEQNLLKFIFVLFAKHTHKWRVNFALHKITTISRFHFIFSMTSLKSSWKSWW